MPVKVPTQPVKGVASLAVLVKEQVNQIVATTTERFSSSKASDQAKGTDLLIALPGTGLNWMLVVIVKCLMLNKLFYKAETDHVSPLKQSRAFN